MYVAGETESISQDAVALVESIIKDQVIHMVSYLDWLLVQVISASN